MSGHHTYRIRPATLEDLDELIRLRLDFLEEVGSLKAGADGGEPGAAMQAHLAPRDRAGTARLRRGRLRPKRDGHGTGVVASTGGEA